MAATTKAMPGDGTGIAVAVGHGNTVGDGVGYVDGKGDELAVPLTGVSGGMFTFAVFVPTFSSI